MPQSIASAPTVMIVSLYGPLAYSVVNVPETAVRLLKLPVLPVTVAPDRDVVNTPEAKLAVVPVTVTPVTLVAPIPPPVILVN